MFPDEVIVKELLPKEKILWCGQPSFRKTFTKFDIFLIPFQFFGLDSRFFGRLRHLLALDSRVFLGYPS